METLTPSSPKEALELQTTEQGLQTGELSEHVIEPLESNPQDATFEHLCKLNEQMQKPRQIFFAAKEFIQEQKELELDLAKLELYFSKPQEGEKKEVVPSKNETPPPPKKATNLSGNPLMQKLTTRMQRAPFFERRPIQNKQTRAHKESSSKDLHTQASFSTRPQEKQKDHQILATPYYQKEKEKDDSQHKQQGQAFYQKEEKESKDQKKKRQFTIEANAGINRGARNTHQARGSEDIGDIYFLFMSLMARILGQAEAEAHTLYQRIKARTDNLDVLTLLISKINSEPGEINWSDNQEMQALVAHARQIGVEIPDGKLEWSEDEKRLLKENIQMKKDSLEKITQLERTDMQRFMQEASQCHQARSNILKLLKEVIDTIIHNFRA